MRLPPAAALCMLSVLGACSFAPPYKTPDAGPAATEYKETAGWKRAQPSDDRPRGNWWQLFGESELDALEARAGIANQNLKAAFYRLQEARADTRIARADFFPNLEATASASRERISPNAPRYIPPGFPTEGNDFVLQADVNWEIDLWGRVRNNVSAARATQQATAADLASLNLSIQAEVATDYFSLRSYDTQQQLLDKTVEDYRQALDLTQTLFDGGAAALADVAQARAQLHGAQTQEADIHLQRSQLEHALAVLVGDSPSDFAMPVKPLPQTAAPPTIEPGLPSALLERRPDVAAAERRTFAANAQIGVARAAYFPQFTLTGSGGYESAHSSNWISAPSLMWSIGPQATLPIFEGGRLVAQTERAKATYAEQVASYRNTVLTAYQDVEDNLAALRQLEQESKSEALAVDDTRLALQKSQDRYVAGLVTYLEVSTTETAALQAQLNAINVQARRLNAAVLLVKALGGSWQASSTMAQTP